MQACLKSATDVFKPPSTDDLIAPCVFCADATTICHSWNPAVLCPALGPTRGKLLCFHRAFACTFSSDLCAACARQGTQCNVLQLGSRIFDALVRAVKSEMQHLLLWHEKQCTIAKIAYAVQAQENE